VDGSVEGKVEQDEKQVGDSDCDDEVMNDEAVRL
jgi:hypothetical protein